MANANRQFQVADAAAQQALVRAQPLATLVIAHAGALHVNHIPLYLDPARGPQGTLIGHVARANTLWPLLPQQAVAVFHGPQALCRPRGIRPRRSTASRCPPGTTPLCTPTAH